MNLHIKPDRATINLEFLGSYKYYFKNLATQWIHIFWVSILVVLSEYLSLRGVCDIGLL